MKINKTLKRKQICIGMYITCTYKNTLITLTRPDNEVFFSLSSRGYPAKMKRKNNAFVLHKMTLKVITLLKKRRSLNIRIFIKGVGQGRYNIIKHLARKAKIWSISDITAIPFNGCRPKKQKRR
jgi:small subunit ribosomal protein S11